MPHGVPRHGCIGPGSLMAQRLQGTPHGLAACQQEYTCAPVHSRKKRVTFYRAEDCGVPSKSLDGHPSQARRNSAEPGSPAYQRARGPESCPAGALQLKLNSHQCPAWNVLSPNSGLPSSQPLSPWQHPGFPGRDRASLWWHKAPLRGGGCSPRNL